MASVSGTGSLGALYTIQQQHALARGVAQASQQSHQPLPILPHLDGLIKTLADTSQRDDLKLKALQEISNSFEELGTTAAYQPLLENLLRSFLKLLQDTVPQFISENNTQQLRKLMLEMILRMSCHDIVKQFSKAIQAQLVKIIQSENEDNALIAIKIMGEHQRTFRPPYTSEILTIINHFKSIYREMPQHIINGRMFEQRAQIRHCGTVNPMEDSVIESSLQYCYMPTLVFLTEADGSQKDGGYLLIPRASQSVKVLSEVPMFIIFLFQIHRHHLQSEMMEFIPLIVQYVNLLIPHEQRSSNSFSNALADDFYNSQVRALTFLGIIARQSMYNMADVMNSHSSSLVQGMLQLMENIPADNLGMRRELIITVKSFFSCEMRTKFIPILPRLFNESLLMGSGFTVNDQMRTSVYSMLADLVHHLRCHLSYVMLCCSVYVFSKSIHDQSLPSYVQSMCCKLIMNLIESFIANEKNHPDQPCRDLLFCILENYVRKFKVIAEFHVPLLLERNPVILAAGRVKVDDKPSSETNEKSNDGSKGDPDGGKASDKDMESIESFVKQETSHIPGATASEGPGNRTTIDVHQMLPASILCKGQTPNQILSQYWVQPSPPMSVTDAKSMVRVLVQACKHIVHGLKDTHMTTISCSPLRELQIMENLLKYGLRCLDVFMITSLPNQQVNSTVPRINGARSKDEKESLDLFASIFTLLNPSVFTELFSKYIDFFIERIAYNYTLQAICNAFLVNPSTSAKFGNILVRYLMKKLPEIAGSNERSALYLKLFKLVFSSVSCSQSTGCIDNERMLRPYLHDMVHQSMELAMRGREPINYFLLLRALFRSIGGGSYDLLYQTFLPLLPTLLQQLNRLQSGSHRTSMRELFVELCLTVPVRLSSLLPYLPLLMDPLVCALNGSPTLVQQGLRTLELCVDNLQPEYLFEHMAPVRAQLMHGLWNSASSNDRTAPPIAIRILGKFGGSNRKMLFDPQKLTFSMENSSKSPAFELVFQRSLPVTIDPDNEHFKEGGGSPLHCSLPLSDAVRAALEHLRSPFRNESAFSPQVASLPSGVQPASLALRRHSFNLIKGVLLCSMSPVNPAVLRHPMLKQHLMSQLEALNSSEKQPSSTIYRCKNEASRLLFLDALTALLYSVLSRDMRAEVIAFFNGVVSQLTVQAIFEQCGISEGREAVLDASNTCMDATILLEAIMNAFSDTSRDLCQAGVVALTLIKDTSIAIYGDFNAACEAPLFRCLMDYVTALCYREAWFARLGGCFALNYILSKFPHSFIVANARKMLAALFEVIIGLTDEVSSSAIDLAIDDIEKLINECFPKDSKDPFDDSLVSVFVKQATTHLAWPSPILREECRKILELISTNISTPVIELLRIQEADISSLLQNGIQSFGQMSLFSQIDFMDAFTYIFTLDPLLLEFRLLDEKEQEFVKHLKFICTADDQKLFERSNYSPARVSSAVLNASNPATRISLRLAAIKALTAAYIASSRFSEPTSSSVSSPKTCFTGKDEPTNSCDAESYSESIVKPSSGVKALSCHDQLFVTILQCLSSNSQKLQETAFQSLRQAIQRVPLKSELLQEEIRTLLLSLYERSQRCISEAVSLRLLYLVRLSPSVFNPKQLNVIADQLLVHLKAWSDCSHSLSDEVISGQILLEILCDLPTADARFIEVVIPLVAKWESVVSLEGEVKWLHALLRFLLRYPLEAVCFFVRQESVNNESIRILFTYVVEHEESTPIRDILINDQSYISRLLKGEATTVDGVWSKASLALPDMEMLALKLITAIGKRDQKWAGNGAAEIVKSVRAMWIDKEFRQRYTCKDFMEEPRYEVPRLAAIVMLRYFKAHIDEMDIIYELCYVFTNQFMSDFTFIRLFIENEIIPTYPIEWRRNALKKLVKMFEDDPTTAHDDNAVKMLQYIITPSLCYAFERYDVDLIIGSPANPEIVEDDNLISLVCQKVLDRTKYQMSDAMLIALFQLGCLFVQNCPTHIHDFTQKKQGNRLRILMLLGWPCLSATPQDQTMKYMGHLLIAHIINQFNINRKIVLQVFHSLLKAHYNDPREVVKKSLDILTPAVPVRMDDGHKQMMSFVKKTIIEEGHNAQQLFHCMSMVVRHYKIYYHVRHQMIQFMMNGVQRLVFMQGSLDNRRLAIDVCEMIIKWEQWRIKQTSQLDEAADMSERSSELSHPPVPAPRRSTPEVIQSTSNSATPLFSSAPSSNISRAQSREDEDLHSPIDKNFVDHVVNLLLKMSTSVLETTGTQQALAMEQLNKRSLGLLRACLKPGVWGHTATIRVQWLEKQLLTAIEPATAQYRDTAPTPHQILQAQTTLDVLAHLVVILPPDVVVTTIKLAQRGIIACLNCQHNPVMRALYQLIGKLFEKTKSSPNGLDELDNVNHCVTKFINDSFTTYEKAPAQPVQGIVGTVHLLRTICSIQPAYIDTTCLNSFVKALQKLVRDHISTQMPISETKGAAVVELIIYSLELLKPRMHAIQSEARRSISQYILQPLIDKTNVDRILDVTVKLVEEMVHYSDEKQPNQGIPLLVRLVQTFEIQKRYEKGGEIFRSLLSIVLYVFETPHLNSADVTKKLSTAFYWGLSVSDENLRNRFFKVFDAQVPPKIYERLYHIVALQNWGDLQHNFWIKHCINLLLSSVMEENKDRNDETQWRTRFLDSATFWKSFELAVQLDDFEKSHSFEECRGTDEESSMDLSEQKPGCSLDSAQSSSAEQSKGGEIRTSLLDSLINKQQHFLSAAARFRITDVIPSVIELIHHDCELASKIWTRLFPSLWTGLTSIERGSLEDELMSFLVSGVHLPQRDQPYSAVSTFLEAICACDPPIHVQPTVLTYLSTTHRSWHRGIMLLEQEAVSIPPMINNLSLLELQPPRTISDQLSVLSCLAELYKGLAETDQLVPVWNRRAFFEPTLRALSLFNQGDFSRAYDYSRNLIVGGIDRLVNVAPSDPLRLISPSINSEIELWEDIWVSSAKELNGWDVLEDYANSLSTQNVELLAEASWHIPNWLLLKQCVAQIDTCTSPWFHFKSLLLKSMLMIHQISQPEREETPEVLGKRITSMLEAASDQLIKEWKRLPKIVSQSHIHILQAAHLLQEISEAAHISINYAIGPSGISQIQFHNTMNGEIKSIVKTWRNRVPTLLDSVSHWIDIYHWRLHHYAAICDMLQSWERLLPNQSQHALLPIHSSSTSQIQIARAARKNGLFNVAIDCLNRMHGLPSIPTMDAHSKVYEHVKCLIQEAETVNFTAQERTQVLFEAMDVLQKSSLSSLTKDQISKLFAVRGKTLSLLDRPDEANNAFSTSARFHESLTTGSPVWYRWAQHLIKIFYSERSKASAILNGQNALVCLLEGARIDNEVKTRKYFAHIFWLIKVMSVYGDEVNAVVDDVLEKFGVGIPSLNWLGWVPQLINELRNRQSKAIAKILEYVGENHEQQIFYAIRCALPSDLVNQHVKKMEGGTGDSSANCTDPFMSTLLSCVSQLCRQRPPDVFCLNQILWEMDSIPESWVERNLRIAKQIRSHLLSMAFENRNDFSSVIVSKVIESELIDWTRSLSVAYESVDDSSEVHFINTARQAMIRDFDLSTLANSRVVRILQHLNDWIAVLEVKFESSPKEGMLVDICPFLNKFNCKAGNVDALIEPYSNKAKEYSTVICRFMPTYQILSHAGCVARRFTVRMLNGKMHTYYLIRSSQSKNSLAILQLFGFINNLLTKEREACRRLAQYVVPKIISTGNSILMEVPGDTDCLPSLFDILNHILQHMNPKREANDLITRYYDRISEARGRITNKLLIDIIRELNSAEYLPTDSLSKWMSRRFMNATHLFTQRKQVALHLSLLCLAEHVFNLTSMDIESMNLNLSTGQLSCTNLEFAFNSKKFELETHSLVPFRLTPNISHFLGLSIEGHFNCCMLAAAQCFRMRDIFIYVRPLLHDAFTLRDESKSLSAEEIVRRVECAVAVMEHRIEGDVVAAIDSLEISDDRVPTSQLILLSQSARLIEHLSRMNPQWHPWF